MSGHSKWSKVKHFKGAVDGKRAAIFTKLGRAITVAAKQGGVDPVMNYRLRTAIQKARDASVPKDTIDRAVARGAGGEDGAMIEEVLYEGFGPGGAALLVHALTDNKNRTLQNVRVLITKAGGSLASQNAVSWMFEKRGVLRVMQQSDVDSQTLALIDAGAQDVVVEDGGCTVTVAPDAVEQIKKVLEDGGMQVEFAEASLVAKEPLVIEDTDAKTILAHLIEHLEEDEDVDEVVTNAVL